MNRKALQKVLTHCFTQSWDVEETLYQRADSGQTAVYQIAAHPPGGSPIHSALKVIRVLALKKEKAIHEVELMRKMKTCKHIVSIEEFCWQRFENEEYLLIRMPLLTSLRMLCDETDIPEKEVVRLGIEICEALECCHKSRVAHRDIKPENIFISEERVYQLGDFGISRILRDNNECSQTAMNEYTPMFAAPEILRAQKADYMLSDMYSLGLVLYKLLNNNILPFGPCGQDELLQKRQSEKEIPPLSNIGEALQSIVWKTLQYEPEKRYQTAEEMKKDLIELQRGGCEILAHAQWLCETGRKLYEAADYEGAYQNFSKAFSSGYPAAKHYVGLCFYHGHGVKQNHDKGVQLLQESADKGDMEAAYCCGMYYYSQTIQKTDYEKAVQYFKVAAEAGHIDAQFRLGYCYRKGYSVKSDDHMAEKWFRKAAAQGHTGAQSYLHQTNYWSIFDWMYINNDTEVRITKCKYIDDFGRVAIPETIEGKIVTELSEQMFLHIQLEKNTKGDTIADLMKQFMNDPDDQRCCNHLRTVYIPESVVHIECGTFFGCTQLHGIHVAPANPRYYDEQGILYDRQNHSLLCYPAGKSESRFVIPANIVRIEDFALKFCKKLVAVELPASLQAIGRMAFSGCSGLTRVEIPESVVSIGDEAFTFCAKLKQLCIPSGVYSIGYHILSRRFEPQILCKKDTRAYWYAGENMIECRTKNLAELTVEQKEFVSESILPLTIACDRHPNGIPVTSGSFQLIMSVCIRGYEEGGKDLLYFITDEFSNTHSSRVREIWHYWNAYIEQMKAENSMLQP
jgi:hypothetical protein